MKNKKINSETKRWNDFDLVDCYNRGKKQTLKSVLKKLRKLETTLINRMCYPNKPVNTFENAREQKEVIEEEFEEVIKELKEGGKEE